MDWTIATFVVSIAVILWVVVQTMDWMNILPARKASGLDFYDVVEYTEKALTAAQKATGSADHAELGDKVAEYLKAKFPKIKDVDIEVAIGSALKNLDDLVVTAPPKKK